MRDLVSLAGHIADLTGGRRSALDLAVRLSREGRVALDLWGGDVRLFIERQTREFGILDEGGDPIPVRAAEFVVVCSILAETREPTPERSRIPGLLFTVPKDAAALVPPGRRLGLAVEDVIRMAERTLRVGAPFWDDPGFDRLLDVLGPAVHTRGVHCAFYVHGWPEHARRAEIATRIARIGPRNTVKLYWYCGPAASLMHAKFVTADSQRGVIGTANLTSFGLEHHVEVGIPIDRSQCEELERLLDGLAELGLFALADFGVVSGPA